MINPEKLRLWNKKSKYLLGASLIGMVLYGTWHVSQTKSTGDMASFKTAIESSLPEEYRDRIFVNEDKQLLGNQYISTVIVSEKESDEAHAKDLVSGFLFKAYGELSQNELPITAITIGLYIRPISKQYRIILGKDLALTQPESFWQTRDARKLFEWLTEVCPTTNPKELNNFCDISDTLRTK